MFQTFHPFVVPICDNQKGKCDFILHSIHFFMKLQMLRWKICQVHYNGKMLMALDNYGFCTHQTKYGLLSLNKIFKYSKTVPLGPHTITKELLAEWQTFLTIVILYNYKCWLTEHAIWQQTDRTCYLATTLCSEQIGHTVQSNLYQENADLCSLTSDLCRYCCISQKWRLLQHWQPEQYAKCEVFNAKPITMSIRFEDSILKDWFSRSSSSRVVNLDITSNIYL